MAALKKSETGLMEVSEENEKIRRSPSNPLPENTDEAKKALQARTAYAKGRKFTPVFLCKYPRSFLLIIFFNL